MFHTRSYSNFWVKNSLSSPIAIIVALSISAFGSVVWASPPRKAAPTARPLVPPPGAHLRAKNACTDQEVWEWGGKVPKPWFDLFTKRVASRKNLLGDYYKASFMKERLTSADSRTLADYWTARVYYEIGLVHLAHWSFDKMLTVPQPAEGPEITGVKFAALECLNRIHRDYGTLTLTADGVSGLLSLATIANTLQTSELVREAAFYYLKGLPSSVSWKTETPGKVFSILSNTGPFEALAMGFWDMRQTDYPAAVVNFRRYFMFPAVTKGTHEGLVPFNDTVHFLLGRIYYEYKEYDKAVDEFKKVSVNSNYFPRSLEDTSWAYLRKKSYNETVGTNFSLFTGGLAKTFNPEAPVITAIALVEICHYPDALRQLKLLQKNYRKPYMWLHDWYSKNGAGESLYQLATDYLKTKKGVPTKVGTEWARSPLFIAAQKEINLIYDEQELSRKISVRLNSAAVKKPAYVKLNSLLSGLEKMTAPRSKYLVDRVNEELAGMNRSMMEDVANAAENAQLVEAEIYNAAGDDMIRMNARPDLIAAAKKVKNDPHNEKMPTWDWGRLPSSASEDEGVEIWDDELGYLKGDLTDQCPKIGKTGG